MELSDKLFDYLKTKLPKFEKVKKAGAYLFTCPNIGKHRFATPEPTATFMAGTDKIQCLRCGFKGTFLDAVRILEPDKNGCSDSEISDYLVNSNQVDMFSELDIYLNYGWALIPIAKNAKIPVEKDWTNIEHKAKSDWLKWLNSGLNIGLKTGQPSNITVVDFDNKGSLTEEQKKTKEEIYKLLEASKTLIANTPSGGKHYVFVYDSSLPQTVNIGELHIDTRNDGGQIVIQPSMIIPNGYRWVNLGAEIKSIPEELKNKLLELLKAKDTSETDNKANAEAYKGAVQELNGMSKIPLKNNNLEGCCNDTFVKLGGALIKKMTPDQAEYALHLINGMMLEHPMESKNIKAMIGSLSGYSADEQSTIEAAVYSHITMVATDVSARDVCDSLKLPRGTVDKYLSKFAKEGKAIKLGRGRYRARNKCEWTNKVPTTNKGINFKIPYFDFLQDFEEGDIIILGGCPGTGKTTTAINILEQVVIQKKIQCYYIFSESGSRHYKIAEKRGLIHGDTLDFLAMYHADPMTIEIEPHAFTIIDWLMIEDKSETDLVFKHLTEEMERKGGILVVMMQLKKEPAYQWYAPNMIDQYPALAARYMIDSEDRIKGHWQIDKVRDSRLGVYTDCIQMVFNKETRLFVPEHNV